MVESEFGALSACIGASAAGARAYTATASQGLLFMAEALPNASGLGLPIVMTVANRALGAPINIWNDHSDALSQRDAGWIQLFAVVQPGGRRPARAGLRPGRAAVPAGDGVHGRLRADPRCRGDRRARTRSGGRLPPAVPAAAVARPGRPGHDRRDGRPGGLHRGQVPDGAPSAAARSTSSPRSPTTFARGVRPRLGRSAAAATGPTMPTWCVVAMGSVLGTAADVVDDAARRGRRGGALGVTCYRPWPSDEVRGALAGVPHVVVVEPGGRGRFRQHPRPGRARCRLPAGPTVHDVVLGLGGRPVTREASSAWCSTSVARRLVSDALHVPRPRRRIVARPRARP